MTLFGESDASCSINVGLGAQGIERAHYLAKYDGRAVKQGHKSPINVSVQYGGDELDDDAVEEVEGYLSSLLTDDIGIRYLRDD